MLWRGAYNGGGSKSSITGTRHVEDNITDVIHDQLRDLCSLGHPASRYARYYRFRNMNESRIIIPGNNRQL
jgi:hypothetical protein